MRNLVVLGGTSHPDLTKSICRILTTEESDVNIGRFSNGETSIEIQGSVRDKDVFIIQSGSGHINDNFVQLLIMIAACKTASARRVTAVLPLFPYSRQPDVPHAAVATGAPSITTKKDTYTYESAPSTPRPWTKSGFDFGTPPPFNLGVNSSSGIGAAGHILPKSFRAKQDKPVERSGERAAERASERISERSTERNSERSTERSVEKSEKSCDLAKPNDSGYKKWISQNGTLIANLLMTAGADRCVTMDLHDPQFQGFFNIPVDNLYSKPLLKHYIIDYIPNYQQCVIVSPDSGGAKRATSIADAIGCQFALIHKERRAKANSSGPPSAPGPLGTRSAGGFSSTSSVNNPNGHQLVATTMLVGDVRDRVCVLVDDLVDTSYTITRAAKLLKDQGASYVYALVTHGVFSGDAINRIAKSSIDKLITTNSTPQKTHSEMLGDKLVVIDVSRVLAEAIRRIHNGESVSMLFDHGW
ncbi:hypothetical protein PGUG_03731 [Meyerozyma guilliermondii ATCC 6260]|uniref:ribose-phosphate diphosphokinase n=1 Tax=Meyerozyma guilliermondii (strain ATCC 6260 / CBS 566 / DSM 6381 / JCM 1539 / NBRC 10279 / NRRL Y-324) TaxID=294746 RepID=A5DKD0_PICGU|nr:uncharacterized protein PGUG_03731 [Meyerozyma guilliermondii ATCC 6260]EDK39633.2 hypothetical protein PGUG_03731 [Meyerozyma guilliermondii ATCC 6260]